MKKQDSFAEDILKSFGNIDDVLIKEAKKTKHKNNKNTEPQETGWGREIFPPP